MHLRLLCAALVLIGLSLFLYRWQILNYPVTPDQDSPVWSVEVQIDLVGEGAPTRVGVFVPPNDGRFGALEEDFISAGLALTTHTDPIGNRSAVWSTGSLDSRTSVYYRALFYWLPETEDERPATAAPETLPEELRFPPSRDDPDQTAAQKLAAEIQADAFDLPNMVSLLLDRLASASPGENAQALIDENETAASRASAAAYVLSMTGNSARVVHGLPLDSAERSVTPTVWLEVWTGETWQSFDVENGDPFTPVRTLVWWRGSQDLVSIDGAQLDKTSIALSRQLIGSVASLSRRSELVDDPLSWASLLDLSVNAQLVFRILLMIPVGALILVILRQVIGVQTLGTFMPVLIALAFRVTDLFYGVLFFTLLVGFGLLVRSYLARLNLLLVPRLAAMLVVVIMLMIGMSLFADAVSLGLGLSVALFPIVILTMTIERMSVTWEENGPSDALQQGFGSLAVAILAYLVMNIPELEHLLFIFPELLLILLAAMLMLGRYTGYRLTELIRFRDLAVSR